MAVGFGRFGELMSERAFKRADREMKILRPNRH
jgi:hypothetical protein